MKRLVAAALLVLGLVAANGCAQIPQSSVVKLGPNINGGLTNENLYYSPVGPSKKATPEQIITGFMSAGTGPQNDYQVAREYLSRSFSAKWNPIEQTLVQSGRPILLHGSNANSYVLQTNVAASVNASGQYLVEEHSKTLNFELVQEAGEWRIQKAPNLTLLIQPVFDVIFQPYSVYFLDKPQQHLVPDVRWFPARANTGTRLVGAMLQGPSPWLTSSLSSAVPSGTKLNTASVTVDHGVATVDLSSRTLKSNAYQRQLIRAQLHATLTQLPNVLDVSVQIDRSPQQIARLADLVPATTSNTAYALIGSRLFEQTAYGSTPLNAFDLYLKNYPATDFALSEDQGEVALLGSGGLAVAYPGTRSAAMKVIDSRKNLTAPEIDGYRMIWSLSRDAGHGLRVYSGHRSVGSFSPIWMKSLARKQFAVSPDDSRLLVSGYRDGKSFVYVVAINRKNTGIPTLATKPLLLETATADSIVLNWVNATDFVMLNAGASQSGNPFKVTIGGDTVEYPSISNVSRLAASASGQQLFVTSQDGDLYVQRNQSWVFVRDKVSAIRFAH